MKSQQVTIWLVLLLALVTLTNSVYSAESLTYIYDTPAPVTLKTLQLKIKDAEADTELIEANKSRLLEYYRKINRYLEQIIANKAATEAFIHSRKVDPERAASIRNKLEQRKIRASTSTDKGLTAEMPFKAIEKFLFTEKANLAAVKAKLSDIEQQLILAAARPNSARQRLIEAKSNQEEITSRLLQPASDELLPILREAMRWMLQTRQITTRTEIRKLDQELLSLPMRIDFLEAGRAWNANTVERLNIRVIAAQEIVTQQRKIEAEKARIAAEKARQKLAGKHALIQQLAGRNAKLTDELSDLSNKFERVTRESDTAKKENERIVKQFQRIRKKLDVGGYGRAEGQVLIELQRQLPEPDSFRKRDVFREHRVAEIGLQQLQYYEEYRELGNVPGYVEQLSSSLTAEQAGNIKRDLKKLAVNRRNLLEQVNQLSGAYLRALTEYEFNDHELLSTIHENEDFLAQNLLWLRSGPLPSFTTLQEMPSQLADLFAPVHWQEVATAFSNQPLHSPILVMGLLLTGILFWKMNFLRGVLRETGANIGKISKDNIGFTFKAFGLTLLLAIIWPLMFVAIAWQLRISTQATEFTNVISYALFRLSIATFAFRMFRAMCEPGGLAEAHFQIPASSVQQLHRELGLLMVIFLPCAFLFVVMFQFDLAVSTGEAGRLLIAVVLIGLGSFFYHISSSKHSAIHDAHQRYPNSRLLRWTRFWRMPMMAVFLALIMFVILGYTYTVTLITVKMIHTLWFVLVLSVIKKMVTRWLLLTQRRLAWQAALKKRAAARAKREAEASGQAEIENEPTELEEPEVDLVALSQESRYLLDVTMAILGMLGLLAIWAQVLPAFNLLNDVVLWKHMALVSGEQQLVPVTLMNIAEVILIVFVTSVAATNLPSLLEIIMLQQTPLTAGSRYTVTTITNYVIIAVGIILFFHTLGVDWSKVQWLIAALGVGIGFGLQEIVANFISGIIILFERPIRVGDIVTIGNNDGVVVRIRIRATTIRNWDRKELLVPNKEFITGQLINWTLSESTTRIVIPVGLAYGSDVELALKLMLEAAQEHADILSDPEPSVVFDAFGDNALSLKLRCFVPETEFRLPSITALHKAINHKFNAAGLVIAFPQRDVHLDASAPLDIRIRRD